MATSPGFIHPDEFWRSVPLRAGQTVVHLGCGAGFYLIPAATIVGPNGKVIGVDIRQDMLDEAMNRAQQEGVGTTVTVSRLNLETGQGDPIPEKIADWVLVANILHQANPTKVLSQARRILKADGTIIVIEWDVIATPLGPPTTRRVAKEDVLKCIKELHLTVTKEFQPSPYHYGLLLHTA